MVIRQRSLWIQRQRLVEIFDCLLRLPNLGVETTAHIIALGALRLGLDGFCRQFNRVLALALGKGNPGLGQQFIRALLRGIARQSEDQSETTVAQTLGCGSKDSHAQWLSRPAERRK